MQTNKANDAKYRKTSAEIISEAKSLLAGGGLRVVQTRRPITPREPTRQLYGRNTIAGRPPSAFSLKYLQYETRTLPILEPIQSTVSDHLPDILHESIDGPIQRSESVGCLSDSERTKLPALLVQQASESLEDLKECVMVRKSELPSRSLPPTSIVKDHPLKRKQPRSFDDKFISSGSAPVGTFDKNPPNEEKKKDTINTKAIKQTSSVNSKSLIRSNDLLAQSTTDTLLEMLKEHSGIKDSSEETILHVNSILLELYNRVKGAKGKWKGEVLGALYGLVESNSPKLLISVARVVLALNVTGSNLTGACKLVFKVARNEVNDTLFIDSDVPELLVDGLGRSSPIDDAEACIYGYGAIRFLASANTNTIINKKTKDKDSKTITISKQKSLAYRLARHGIIQLMILHLQLLNEFGSNSKLCGPPLHALFQLSGALRTLSGAPIFAQIISARSRLLADHGRNQVKDSNDHSQDIQLELAGKHLVRSAEICMEEPEVQANIIRTLSVLSDIEQCCEFLADASARLGILFGSIRFNQDSGGSPEKSLGIVSRLGYILGNIMARNDQARVEFYENDVAMEYLLSTLEFYSNQRFEMRNNNGDSVVDVLIKIVRVIANMSVNGEVGLGLGHRPPIGGVLLNILLSAKDCKVPETEELLLATLGALHNLSYYQNSNSDEHLNLHHPGSIIERMKDISSTLCQILHMGPIVTKPEAARVLGNMTRNQIARQSFCSSNGLKVVVKTLKSDNFELVATCCGVLVNLMGDWERRAPFKELNGPKLLRDVLQRSANEEDWILAGMCCQALWNFLIDSSNVIDSLGEDEADHLAGELADYLDEEKIFQGQPPDVMWEQFASVATDLLERIQSSMSILSSPCLSSDEGDGTVDAWGGKYKQWLQE